MRWPWTQPKAASPEALPSQSLSAAAVEPVATVQQLPAAEPQQPQDEWMTVSPLKTTADGPSLGSSTAFLSSLATRQSPPPMLQRLSHNRGADAPAGIAVGVARGIAPTSSPAFSAPGVRGRTGLREPASAAVQRQPGLGYWIAQAPPPEAPSEEPGTSEQSAGPVMAEPAAEPFQGRSPSPRFAARESLSALPSAALRSEAPPAGSTGTFAAAPNARTQPLVAQRSMSDVRAGQLPMTAIRPDTAQPGTPVPPGTMEPTSPVQPTSPQAGRPVEPTHRQLPVVTGPATAPLISRLELPAPRRVTTPAPGAAQQASDLPTPPTGETPPGSPSMQAADQLVGRAAAGPGPAGSPDASVATSPLLGSESATGMLASSTRNTFEPAGFQRTSSEATASTGSRPAAAPEPGTLPTVSRTIGSPAAGSQPTNPPPGVSRTTGSQASGGAPRGSQPAGSRSTGSPQLGEAPLGSAVDHRGNAGSGLARPAGSPAPRMQRQPVDDATPTEAAANSAISSNPAAISFDASHLTGELEATPVQPAHRARGLGEPLTGMPKRLRGDDALRATSTSPSPLPPPRLPEAPLPSATPSVPVVIREPIESVTRESVIPRLAAAKAGPEPMSTVAKPSVQRAVGPEKPPQSPLVGDAPLLTTPTTAWTQPADQPAMNPASDTGNEPESGTPAGAPPPAVLLNPEPARAMPTIATRQNLPPATASRASTPAPVARRVAHAAETVPNPSTPNPDEGSASTTTRGSMPTLPPRIQRLEAPPFVPMMDEIAPSQVRQLAVAPTAATAPSVQREASPAVEEAQTSAAAAPAAAGGNPAELADQLYEHIAGRLRRDLLIERERSSLLLDR